MQTVGVDGCKGGWVAVALDSGRFGGARLCADFGAVLAAYPGAQVIAVDMPIGLVERGFRACDLAARAQLRGRAATLFLVPPAAALRDCDDYQSALARCRELTGAGLSKQAFGLRAKILEVDAHARDPRVFEVHPELSFLELSGGRALPRKKSWAGMSARRALLADAGIAVPDELGPAGRAAPDDVLDAAAAAWSGLRIAAARARRLPSGDAQRDHRGRPIAIWV